MLRLIVIATAICCFCARGLPAAEPVATVIVASDPKAASTLPHLPTGLTLAVLIQDEDETYHAVNERALAMRQATYFVYVSGQESLLSAMYRERLAAQGVIAIDLKQHLPGWRFRPVSDASQLSSSFLATLSTNR